MNKYAGIGSKADRKTRYRKSSLSAYTMCVKKTAFLDESQAMATGKKFGQRAYQCPKCTAWHLTSQNGGG